MLRIIHIGRGIGLGQRFYEISHKQPLNYRYLTNTPVSASSTATVNVAANSDVVAPFDAKKLKMAYYAKQYYETALYRNSLNTPQYHEHIGLISSNIQVRQDQGLTTNIARNELSKMFNKEFVKEMWYMAPFAFMGSCVPVIALQYLDYTYMSGTEFSGLFALTMSTAISSSYLAHYYGKHRKVIDEILDTYYAK